jgi:hypothetical protein
MKLCASPANTTCMYQRIARDQADPDEAGASSDAYEELCTFLADHLDPNDLGEAEALLRRFVDQTGSGNLGTDEPPPFPGRPRPGGVLSMDEMHRRVAVGAKISAGKVLAQLRSFNTRFPGASRIRNV